MDTHESNTINATENDLDIPSFPDDGLNSRQRDFADFYLSGHFAKQAAILAGYSADNASRIATRLLKAPAIVAYLSAERDRLAVESFYSRRLLVDWLWKVIHSSPDDIQEGDNIIQELTIRELANGERVRRVKLVNKMAALRQLARMHGYDKPELCLPGDLAGMFKPFQAVNDLGQAPRPTVPPSLPARDRSPTRPAEPARPTSNAQGPPQSSSSDSLPGRDRSPSGPVDAAHPSLNDQGLPQSRSSDSLPGRDRSPSGPVDAAHPTHNDQGPRQSRSSDSLPGRDRSPSGPVDAAHPTHNDQGPRQSRFSDSLPGRDRFASVPPPEILQIVPSGPADAVHSTPKGQGPAPGHSSTSPLNNELAPISLPATISRQTPPAPSTAIRNQPPSPPYTSPYFPDDLHDGPPPVKAPSFSSPASDSGYSLFSS